MAFTFSSPGCLRGQWLLSNVGTVVEDIDQVVKLALVKSGQAASRVNLTLMRRIHKC